MIVRDSCLDDRDADIRTLHRPSFSFLVTARLRLEHVYKQKSFITFGGGVCLSHLVLHLCVSPFHQALSLYVI